MYFLLIFFEVRRSTKALFDEAVDGIPPAVIAVSQASDQNSDNGDRKRETDHSSRRRSRSRSREKRRNRRDSSPRKRP
ncbi:hypothetical protein NECAME_14891, partial [Necator americanus]